MRVISGFAKGIRLKAPGNSPTRPMLDRVKESLFNIIRNEIEGANVLDLFSGTGSLGIETLSRGANFCVFVEHDRQLCEYIRLNLEKCKFDNKALILQRDVFKLNPGEIASAGKISLIICDPPYCMVEDPNSRSLLIRTLDKLCKTGASGQNLLLVIHHAPPETILWSSEIFVVTDRRRYGNSVLTFFKGRKKDDKNAFKGKS